MPYLKRFIIRKLYGREAAAKDRPALDYDDLCPEFIDYSPVLKRISSNEVLMNTYVSENQSIKIGDSIKIISEHEGDECTLKEIKRGKSFV